MGNNENGGKMSNEASHQTQKSKYIGGEKNKERKEEERERQRTESKRTLEQ